MRDEIKGSVSNDECLILNIDDSSGDGTYWTCLWTYGKGGKCLYFDSCDFVTPVEVQNYYSGYYNSFKFKHQTKSSEVITAFKFSIN